MSLSEHQAREWLKAQSVPRETMEKLEAYVAMLLAGADRQNLIAASTKDEIWARHIVDSAQLLPLAPVPQGTWVDLGSGAGLPGIVIAILSPWPVVLSESRRKRIEFLCEVVRALDLSNVTVAGQRAETLTLEEPAQIISARAYAPLPKLFATARHLADPETFWLLPKGKSWQNDLADAQTNWQGSFHVEQSATDSDSAIIVAHSVRQKKAKR